jgi:hypothetical protein
MKALTPLILLAVCTVTAAAKPTGNELMLLRMTLRQEVTADVQAAAQSADAVEQARTAPLEAILAGVPDRNALYVTMTDPANDTAQRFNAARALAYLGDARSIPVLTSTLQGQSRLAAGGTEKSKAALCLLYLGYDFAPDFAFSKIPTPLYAELDALIKAPSPPLSTSSVYTSEQLQATLKLYLATAYLVNVWGPLAVLEVEQESLASLLRSAAEGSGAYTLRIPFGMQAYEWEDFKAQIRKTDLIYHFRSEDAAWAAHDGCEGYALFRGGQVVATLLTATNRPAPSGLLAFQDFNQRLGLAWEILNPDPAHWSLAKVPGTLTITTQDGSFTRERQDYRNVFLIANPAAPGQDFQVTTCLMSFAPTGLWNQAGLLLWDTADHHLKFDCEYGEGPPIGLADQRMFTLGHEVGGVAYHAWFRAPQNAAKIWLRVVKRGGYCELYTSTDGQSFTAATALVPWWGPADNREYWGNGPIPYIGVYADNGTARGAPSVDASFDYFEVKALSQ